jgi:hypothetical protein
MLDQECGREASPCWVRKAFLVDGGASKLKGKTGTIINRCFDKNFLAVSEANNLVVILNLRELK